MLFFSCGTCPAVPWKLIDHSMMGVIGNAFYQEVDEMDVPAFSIKIFTINRLRYKSYTCTLTLQFKGFSVAIGCECHNLGSV